MIQKEKIAGELKTQTEKDLLDKFDCIVTPKMEDFEVKNNDKMALMVMVKRIAYQKKFQVVIN